MLLKILTKFDQSVVIILIGSCLCTMYTEILNTTVTHCTLAFK